MNTIYTKRDSLVEFLIFLVYSGAQGLQKIGREEMKSRVSTTIKRMGICALLACSIGSVSANESLATLSGGSDIFLTMNTNQSYQTVVLSVAGPDGYTYDKEFRNNPSIAGPLEDGLYKYELYLAPARISTAAFRGTSGNNSAIDENGRPAGIAQARGATSPSNQRRGHVQSGTFSIQNGQLVNNSAQEQ